MDVGLIIVAALLVFIAVTLAKGVRLVPQGEEWIVERLGKYHGTIKPGLYADIVATPAEASGHFKEHLDPKTSSG